MNRTARALRATALFTGFSYAAQALSLVAIPLYLKTVGAEGYGLIVVTMAFMGYLNFADAGLSWGSIILIGLAHGRKDQAMIGKIVRNSMVLAVGSALVVLCTLAILLVLAAQGWRLPMFATSRESDRLLLIAGCQLAITLQTGVFYNAFQGLQEAHWTAFYQGLGRLVSTCLMMWAAWVWQSVQLVMVMQLAATVAFAGACGVHLWRRHPWIFSNGSWVDPEQLRLQLRTGAKVFALQIGRTIVSTAPSMSLSAAYGPASVPLFTVPYSLLQLLFTPLNAWSTSLHSAYGEAWESGDRTWVRETFRHALERGLFWAALGAAAFLPLATPFVALWTGGRLVLPAFMPAAVVAICLLGWFLQTGQYLLSGLNRQRKVALYQIGCGCLTLGLAVLTVRWFGPAGVGVGVLAGAVLTILPVTVREINFHVGGAVFPAPRFFCIIGGLLVISGAAGAAVTLTVQPGGAVGQLLMMSASVLVVAACYLSAARLLRLEQLTDAWAALAGVLRKG